MMQPEISVLPTAIHSLEVRGLLNQASTAVSPAIATQSRRPAGLVLHQLEPPTHCAWLKYLRV